MKEYIEREEVLKHKRKMSGADFGGNFWDEAVLCEDIRKIPAADVAPVVHGEWLVNEYNTVNEYDTVRRIVIGYLAPISYRCSICGRVEEYQHPYCNCGALMDGGNE